MEDASLVGVGSEEPVLPQSKVRELEARIKQLERALGRASLDNEILREAVKIGRKKKLISRQPLEWSKLRLIYGSINFLKHR